jgi:enamine deaminase RidA (YjgF/YER057c/UK114 family)
MHYGVEEMFFVLAGMPTVRTPEGEEQLSPGDVVYFPEGPDGLHDFSNPTDQPARILGISTKRFPDVVAYPERGVAWVATRHPERPVPQGGDGDIIARFELPPEKKASTLGTFADARTGDTHIARPEPVFENVRARRTWRRRKSMQRTSINPVSWSTKLGFDQAQLIEDHQRLLVCSGQDAVDADGNAQHPGDMAAQLEMSLDNLEHVLAAADMTLANVVRLNVYTTDFDELVKHWTSLSGRFGKSDSRFTTTLLGVTRLFTPQLLVLLEATAVD